MHICMFLKFFFQLSVGQKFSKNEKLVMDVTDDFVLIIENFEEGDQLLMKKIITGYKCLSVE